MGDDIVMRKKKKSGTIINIANDEEIQTSRKTWLRIIRLLKRQKNRKITETKIKKKIFDGENYNNEISKRLFKVEFTISVRIFVGLFCHCVFKILN